MRLCCSSGDGTERSLSDWKGSVVLLNIWATWCAPCRYEMPTLDALNKQFGEIIVGRRDGFITTTITETTTAQTIEFLEQYVPKGKSPMCGNSICQDRRFLARTMPTMEAFFHYRNLDVSSIKEMAKRWKPEILAGFSKKNTHKALDDIRESIEELKYYREHFIVKD